MPYCSHRNMSHILALFYAACACLLQTGLVRAEILLTGTAGHSAELACLTRPNTSVSWQYRRERTDPEQYICIDGNVLPSWQHKYALTTINSGKLVLVVGNANFNDSGIYSCIDDGGIGDKNSVRLQIVPEVESTQPTPCLDDPAEIQCSCSTPTALSVVIIILVICTLIVVITLFVNLARRGKFVPHKLRSVKGKTYSEGRRLLSDAKAPGDTVSRRVINKDTWVSGVTIVNNNIYLLRGKLLQVYNSKTEDRLESHTIDRLYRHYRNDMTSCSDHRCLYISDYYHKKILRISLPISRPMSEKATTEWETECRPSGLSVTGSHTLLVTSFDACRFLELNTDGTKVREIKLESDVEWPMHAIQLGSGNFVVCHGGDGVWLVDANGSIKETYGGEQVRAEGPLAWPCHVAVRKDGSILVADHYNDRILQLNADLRYVGEAVQRHQLQRPRRLLLSGDKERLYVGQWNGELTYFDLM